MAEVTGSAAPRHHRFAVSSEAPREFGFVLRPRGRPARRLDRPRPSDTVKTCALSCFASPQRQPYSWPPAAAYPFPPTAPCTVPVARRADARSLRPGRRRCCCPPGGRRTSGWWMWRPCGGRRNGTRRHTSEMMPPPGIRRRETNGRGAWDGHCRAPLTPRRRGHVRSRYGRRPGIGATRPRAGPRLRPRLRESSRGPRGPGPARTPAWCAGWRPATSVRTFCSCATGRTDAEAVRSPLRRTPGGAGEAGETARPLRIAAVRPQPSGSG
ncbi:hypothetical protein SAMN05428945_5516 [Streptomyces sp. 2224.1]|nr:hypothetical protein SAMN05428945_5516 [Streptomyces sp. 2224.1]